MPPSEECCEGSVVTRYKGCPGWQSSDFRTWSGPAFWGEQVTPLRAAPTCSPALYSPAPTLLCDTRPWRPLMPLLWDVRSRAYQRMLLVTLTLIQAARPSGLVTSCSYFTFLIPHVLSGQLYGQIESHVRVSSKNLERRRDSDVGFRPSFLLEVPNPCA